MDHYKVLGVHSNASKEEIKQAFRNLAMQFHPDKHVHSPKHLKDVATFKFKQLSEAYEILIDDRKRADYNIGRQSNSSSSSSSWNTNYYYNNRKYYNNNSGYGYRADYSHKYTGGRGKTSGTTTRFDSVFTFLNARSFLCTAAVVGVLMGGMYFIDSGVDALWNSRNSGKSLEDALESIKQAKTVKDKG